MMTMTHRIGWTLIGILIGALMTGSLGASRSQSRQNPEPRLSLTPATTRASNAGTSVGSLVFIKDLRGSGGCWLAYSKGTEGFSSIVVAPPGACD